MDLKQYLPIFLLVSSVCGLAMAQQKPDPIETEIWEPEPAVITPGAGSNPPSDAIVLLGDDLSSWTVWEKRSKNSEAGDPAGWSVKDGVATVVPQSGSIRTRQHFGSIQLHLEWRTPVMEGEGQGKANSGVFFQERYEVQILDSFQNRTYSNGQAGSVYKQYIPLVNASRPPGQWQSYDIIFQAPRFDQAGVLLSPAYVTVMHNGVLIQNHVELLGGTSYRGAPSYQAHGDAAIALQDHGDAVSYRNIWVRELDRP